MLLEDFKGRFDYVSMHLVLDEPYELEFKKRVSDMYKGLGFEEKEEDYFAWERSNDTEGLGQTPASIASVDTAPYYVTEITDEGEMAGTLDRWFSSQEERYFDRPDWRVSLKRPNSVMFRLESGEGEVLAMCSVRKVDRFMFSQDHEKGTEDVVPAYVMDLGETTKSRRGEGIGKMLVVKVCEKALADPDIKDRVIVIEPGSEEADGFWSEKIEAVPFFLYSRDLHPGDLTEEERWRYLHRVIYRETAERLVSQLAMDKLQLPSNASVRLQDLKHQSEAINSSL